MKPIRALIVDDEALCRKGIRLLLEEDGEFQISGESSGGREAVDDILDKRPDVAFLDIQMPGMSGFDVLRRIDPDRWPVIVFVTAYDEHAVKAFELHAVDYVLKPFTKDRFRRTMAKVKKTVRERDASALAGSLMRLLSSLESGQGRENPIRADDPRDGGDRILVSDRGTHQIVWVKDIEWIEGADYYVHLHGRTKSWLHRERLKNLERTLPSGMFFRVHKSAIINLRRLDKIIEDYRGQVFALMLSGAKVKVSRNRKPAFFDRCRGKSS